MPKPSEVSLRVKVPLALYERISAYRHEARHESRAEALTCLLGAGLAALQRPLSVPVRPFSPAPPPDLSGMAEVTPGQGKRYSGPVQPKLVAYAGSEK